MKSMYRSIAVILILTLYSISTFAHNPIGDDGKGKKVSNPSELLNGRFDCTEPQLQTDQDINNVRARLLTGGDVWWDLQNGRYIVPKPAPGELEVSSIFNGGVWIGGFDPSGNLKLAGVTYRTQGSDWYSGPLDTAGVTNDSICSAWDQFFEVEAEDIDRHNAAYEAAVASGVPYDCDSIPESIRAWPGRGNPDWNQFYDFDLLDQPLGDFFDNNQDEVYDPCDGDFPYIFIEGCAPNDFSPEIRRQRAKELVPDEMIFWIYNDNGGPHFSSRATPIQMEVQVQAFGYATNDELNDMTFQRYRLINKASTDIIDCYFGMYTDPDLGCSDDDFIGCDPVRELMYVYNEDPTDGITGCACPVGSSNTPTYCNDVPILGIDYFRGPLGPKIFLRDQNTGEVLPDSILVDPPLGSGRVDTLVELGMTSFTYFNRINQQLGDPNSGEEFYRYLTGRWRDNTPFTFGGDGYNPGSTDTIPFAFPNDPDDPNGWSMCTAELPFDDRRTVQATGPLLLQPDAINELIIGVVWVPSITYPCPDLDPLLSADLLAQNLFDACFDITDGPDAPDLTALELDRELILVLSNDTINSNNAFLSYSEIDLKSTRTDGDPGDDTFRFEGYRIYQLSNATVSPSEFGDPSKARQVAQVDIRNGVSSIYNWQSVPNPDPTIPPAFFPMEMVTGEDQGLRSTFQILNDAFATGDDIRLVNHKRYYYSVVSYAYNNFRSFDQTTREGQRSQYLEGRGNIRTYTLVPRPIVYDSLNVSYGFGPSVTRISGQGSGGINIKISKEMREQIARDEHDGKVVYNIGAAPIDVKIYDPYRITNDDYELEIVGEMSGLDCGFAPGATWRLTNLNTQEQFFSEADLSVLNEQIIYGKGFTVTVNQVQTPATGIRFSGGSATGEPSVANNGAVAQEAEYENPLGTEAWYRVAPEALAFEIAPGFTIPLPNDYLTDQNSLVDAGSNEEEGILADPNDEFTSLGANLFHPFYHMSDRFGANMFISPAAVELSLPRLQREEYPPRSRRIDTLKLSDLNNVDIVFTPNKDLWSRCIVIEAANPDNLGDGVTTIGEVDQWELRQSESVDKNGNPDGDGVGMSWFPGYAVDVTNGQRLNIFFAENSAQESGIGKDMIWNPSDRILADELTPATPNNEAGILGGHHFVYVTRAEYDSCKVYRELLGNNPSRNDVAAVTAQVTWASFPVLIGGKSLLPISEGLIPNELTVSCRVNTPFGEERFVDQDDVDQCDSYLGNPKYLFSFDNVAPSTLTEEDYAGALANVRVVPNPYYAYASYENNSFENRVKVTNLPARATVTIYSLDGRFIRRFDRDEDVQQALPDRRNLGVETIQPLPDLEWDLNNFAAVPVASGVYIFHIVAPDLGEERSIKWFGVKRRFDPSGL